MPKHESKGPSGGGLSFFWTLVCAVIISVLLRAYVVETISVDGPSMQPTLYTDWHVVVDKVTYRFFSPKRYDIIVCKFEGQSDTFIKRIIALPGETVEIRGGAVYIDGEPLAGDTHANGVSNRDYDPITVPEGYLFVMGDNRGNSRDSREMGCVRISDILGVARAIIWPLDKLGGL